MSLANNDHLASEEPVADAVDAGAGAEEANRYFTQLRQRTEELSCSGIREGHARGLAELEMRLNRFPALWNNDLVVLIYGDFYPLPAEMTFTNLGITLEPEPVTNSVIRSAMCVLKARVKTSDKSLTALADATARLNTLLGVLSVLNWGNCGFGWWSAVSCGSMGGLSPKLEPDRVQSVVEAIGKMSPPVARKVRSALYWIREPRNLLMESHRSDVLRVYAGYWNAFECLVEAVCLLHPQPKLGKAEKQTAIDTFVAERNGKLNAAAVSECYKAYVDPGFVGKASYALKICFPEQAELYVMECFRMKPDQDRLYNIRNAINHGDVDADNPSELLRVEDRHIRLWMIVFGMLGLMIPIDHPLDQSNAATV